MFLIFKKKNNQKNVFIINHPKQKTKLNSTRIVEGLIFSSKKFFFFHKKKIKKKKKYGNNFVGRLNNK